MDRLAHHNAECYIGSHLARRVFAAVTLGVLCMGMTHGQVSVKSVILTNSVTTPGKPLKTAASDPIQLMIDNPTFAEASHDSAGKGPSCMNSIRSHSEVTAPIGKSTMVQLSGPVRNRTAGSPNVVQAMLVSPQALYVLGLEVGSTGTIVQGRSGPCSVMDAAVGANPDGLQSTLRKLMPEAWNVQVSAAADSLVPGGSVSDSVQAQKVVDIADAFVVRRTRGPNGGDQNATGQGGQQPHTASPGTPLHNPRIINVVAVEAPQQVMLEAKVAGVSKTLTDQIGAVFNANGMFDSWSFGAIVNFLSGSSDTVDFNKANHSSLRFALDTQKGGDSVKMLAKPSLMAISGQEVSSLASGKVFIPVAQGATANGVATITLQGEAFGVGLHSISTVMKNGRINLKMPSEVSELSPTDVAVTVLDSNDTPILSFITTRRASATLQVHNGQSFIIGGLTKNNITDSLRVLLGISELPIIDSLAHSTGFQWDQTELPFVVTPWLIRPSSVQCPLSTGSSGATNRDELYLNGSMEGHVQVPADQPTAVAALAINPGKAIAEPTVAPGPSAQALTPTNVPAAPAAPITPVAPAASTAPRDIRRFIATGGQSTGN